MTCARYKDFLREEVRKKKQKLENTEDLAERYRIKREIMLLESRIGKDIRMRDYGVDI